MVLAPSQVVVSDFSHQQYQRSEASEDCYRSWIQPLQYPYNLEDFFLYELCILLVVSLKKNRQARRGIRHYCIDINLAMQFQA